MKIYLQHDCKIDQDEYDAEDEWDRSNTYTDWNIGSISNVPFDDGSHEYSYVENDLELGTIIYGLVVIYSTGDSFGHDLNKCCELVYVDADLSKVSALETKITNNPTESFPEIPGLAYAPWTGYFENLSYCEVVEGIIE